MTKLDNRGFSLLELLIAVVILAVGLLAMAGLQTRAIKGNFHGGTISLATALAEERAEEIRNTDYDSIAYDPNPDVEANIKSGSSGNIFTRETLVENDIPMTGMKKITVSVHWETDAPHQVTIRTIVAKDGD